MVKTFHAFNFCHDTPPTEFFILNFSHITLPDKVLLWHCSTSLNSRTDHHNTVKTEVFSYAFKGAIPFMNTKILMGEYEPVHNQLMQAFQITTLECL